MEKPKIMLLYKERLKSYVDVPKLDVAYGVWGLTGFSHDCTDQRKWLKSYLNLSTVSDMLSTAATAKLFQ